MKMRGVVGKVALGFGGITLAAGSYAFTGSTGVPASRGGTHTTARTIAQLLPAECAGIGATSLVTGTGTFSGTTSGDLMLAGAGIDAPSGGQGNDCIHGGGGADTISGGSGTDVCIGGPGIDTFSGCETQIQ